MENKVIEKKFLLPFILITTLFALWGVAANMTDTLLAAFRKVMQMSDTQTTFIQMAFYGAYFFIALPAALFIRKHSYKSGVILGLILYATGAILFLPAAWAASYAFYLFAIYVMATGCSVLETTSNPYILAMGSQETATRRLNIAQAFNPIGCITGILISKYFILQDISLYSISGTYAALGGHIRQTDAQQALCVGCGGTVLLYWCPNGYLELCHPFGDEGTGRGRGRGG